MSPLLHPLIRTFGRTRLRRLGLWLLFVLLTATLATVALRYGLLPALAALAPATLPAELPTYLSLFTLALSVGFLMLAALFWRAAVVAPLQKLRLRLRDKRAQRRADRSDADTSLRQLSEKYEQRAGQLHAVLQMNRGFREKLGKLDAEQQAILRSREALLNLTQDAMLLTDASGLVLGLSPAACTLLRAPRESLLGRSFDEVTPLSESGDSTRPVRDLIRRSLDSGSAIPQLREAQLITPQQQPLPVMITAAAILDPAGKAIGAMVRINRFDGAPQAAAAASALSLSDANLHDWGTNLLSREPFERRVGELVNSAKADGGKHVLLYLRVDELARVNDEHGFWASEQLLWHAARNFAMSLTDTGTGYRASNSRFAALLVDCEPARAMQIAEALRSHAQTNDLVWEGKTLACTFSIAVVVIDGRNELQELLADAETLLAEAKTRGGNAVLQTASNDTVKQRRRDDQLWLDWILPRLEDGRAHLISQVMQPLGGGDVQPMVEFFIRVEDDDGVWLEPGYYLPAIERLRQSQRVDLWVLRTLLQALERNPGVLGAHAAASINLSSSALLDADFAATVFEILGNASVSPSQLCFEIDESFALAQSSVVQRFIEQLRPLGPRFALDRCRTTMGITQLRHLPVDYMKIHPRVTQNVASDPLERTHVEWLCQAAHLLGRKTAAVNIESTELVERLRRAGVDYAQGTAVNKLGPLMT
ncbi:MAG TPA: EAL domain-containing protein [Solimonas sp.]